MGTGVKYNRGQVRALMDQRGLAVWRLAELAEVDGQALTRWQAGQGHPSLVQLQALAQALRAPVADLVAVEAFEGRTRKRAGLRNWAARAEIDLALGYPPAPEPPAPAPLGARWAAQAARRKATLAARGAAKGADTPEKGQNGPSERL